MVRIVFGHELGVRVDRIVVVEGVAQVIPELGQEAGCDQSRGSGVDAGFALESKSTGSEPDGYIPQIAS